MAKDNSSTNRIQKLSPPVAMVPTYGDWYGTHVWRHEESLM